MPHMLPRLEEKTPTSIENQEQFWHALEEAAASLLLLPDEQLKEILQEYGSEDAWIITKVADRMAELVIPYDLEDCIALMRILPWSFEGYVAYDGDGEVTAKEIFGDKISKEIKEHLDGWEHDLAYAARRSFSKPEPPDPFVGWTVERWRERYLSLRDAEEQARLRYAAQERAVDTSTWPVAEELRQRYRTSSPYQGFLLRREAQQWQVDAADWRRDPGY